MIPRRPVLSALGVLAVPGAARAAGSVLADGATLRAVYIRSNLAQARIDAAGTVTGVAADLARELARRSGLAAMITPVETAAAVLEAVRSGAADIGFVAPNPDRTGLVLYSQTYMLVQQSALVRDDSPFRSVAELDRPGTTIGVNTGDSVGTWLRTRLTAARLRETPDTDLRDAVRWFADGSIQAFAGNRERLRHATRNDPDLHLLPDNLYAVPQTIAVPLDRPGRLAAIDAAISALRTEGFLAEAVTRSGVDGISVAPGPGVAVTPPAAAPHPAAPGCPRPVAAVPCIRRGCG